MKPTRRAVFAVLFSFLLLSVLFSSSLNYYLQGSTLNNHRPDNIWLSNIIKFPNVLKGYQQNALTNITKEVSAGILFSHRSEKEITTIIKTVGDTKHKYHRYAISSSYWEQQTNAVLNMFCMQRWANSIGLTVVEPFVCQSELKFPKEVLYNNSLANTLRLRDYIDLDYWNAQTDKSDNILPLETWENFFHHSTKKIVVVIMSHFGAGGTYTNDEINSHPNCHKVMSIFYHKHSMLFQSLQFQVVRNVCFSFFEHIMSVETFNAGLQIENEKDVTVWITEWRGVENGRISFTGLGDNEFGRTHGGEYKLLSMIHSSDRLLNDSQSYIHQVLGVNFYQYHAVVIRVKPINGYTVEMNVQHYNNCATLLENYQKRQKQVFKNHRTFLAIDMGKFGDMVRGDSFDYDSQGKYTGHGKYLFQRYLKIVYGNKTIDNYDNDFVRVTNGIMDSGYIGALQKTIAVHAERALIVGGRSTFQKVIMQHFSRRHANYRVTTLCYEAKH